MKEGSLMKNFMIIVCLLTLIGMGIALNVHVIRTGDGFEMITKDHMTFRDTYVDVRDWSLPDYVTHAPRIRNYLLYEKQYNKLVKMIDDEKKKSEGIFDKAKKKLEPIEKALRDWISE